MTNNTTEKQYFTIKEALEDIKDTLENGYDGYLCDLYNEVFNTDYYIIGTYEAKQALSQYDVFEAIEEVQTYELNHFGEILTPLHNPEKLANMLYYIIGEKAISLVMESNDSLYELWGTSDLSDEQIDLLVATIDSLIENI